MRQSRTSTGGSPRIYAGEERFSALKKRLLQECASVRDSHARAYGEADPELRHLPLSASLTHQRDQYNDGNRNAQHEKQDVTHRIPPNINFRSPSNFNKLQRATRLR